MINGITVTLYTKTKTGTDGFGDPVYTETAVEVDDVLVYPSTGTEILETVNLYGKKAVYTMAIPKGDTHDWEDQIVEFFGHRFRTFGIPVQGIEANIPLSWHKKVRCERYE